MYVVLSCGMFSIRGELVNIDTSWFQFVESEEEIASLCKQSPANGQRKKVTIVSFSANGWYLQRPFGIQRK